MINIKHFVLTLVFSLTPGIYSPASAIVLNDLVTSGGGDDQIDVSGGTFFPGVTFTFSNFSAPNQSGSQQATWLAFQVAGTVSDTGPSLLFSGGPLTLDGDYQVIYQLTYSGPLDLRLVDYIQAISCLGCSGETSTELGELEPPFTGSNPPNPVIGGALNDEDGNINKSGGVTSLWSQTTINVADGDSYEGFEGTYDVQEIPWETDALPFIGATFLFGGGVWWKRRRGTGQLEAMGLGSDQEPGQE